MEKRVENAVIKSADLSMEDHGWMTLMLHLEGNGWGCTFGGYCLGRGYLGAKEFEGSAKGVEEIMRIMDVVGVSKFSNLSGKHIRVETSGWGGIIKKIGNIIEDKWFDYDEFYKEQV